MTKDEIKAAFTNNYLRIEENLERNMHSPPLIEALLEKKARAKAGDKGQRKWRKEAAVEDDDRADVDLGRS